MTLPVKVIWPDGHTCIIGPWSDGIAWVLPITVPVFLRLCVIFPLTRLTRLRCDPQAVQAGAG